MNGSKGSSREDDQKLLSPGNTDVESGQQIDDEYFDDEIGAQAPRGLLSKLELLALAAVCMFTAGVIVVVVLDPMQRLG